MKFEKLLHRLPWITGLFLAIFWGCVYAFFAKLHGMQSMFDQQFPFLIAWLLGVHNGSMSVLCGTFFAILDAGVLGFTIGWILRYIFKLMK